MRNDNFSYANYYRSASRRRNNKPVVYLSGPMAGLDWEKVEIIFTQYANIFKALGFDVLNPINFHHEDTNDRLLTLEEDFRHLDTADYIFMMPGWENTRGCNAEWGYANAIGLRILKFSGCENSFNNFANWAEKVIECGYLVNRIKEANDKNE